jgi:hypothetical protein
VRKGNNLDVLFDHPGSADPQLCSGICAIPEEEFYDRSAFSKFSLISHQSSQEQTIQNSFTGLKFRVDKFMFLNSEPKHM